MAKKTAGWLLIGLCCLIFFSPETGTASIGHIKEFLNTCPQNDPAYNQIRNDFIIRRNGVVVGDIPCTEPTSSLNIAQYSDELIVLQGLRAIYYMDYGQAGHLPWTTGTLYQWMKSKIGGINIDDFAGSSWCCQNFGGKLYFVAQAQDAQERDNDRHWKNLSGNISLYAHEVRHVDGFGHPACCIYPRCDQTFDPTNLSPIGIQWWLNKLWLTGEINVGAACLEATERQETIGWFLSSTNSEIVSFCDSKPPAQTVPAAPLGPCLAVRNPAWKVQTVDSTFDFGQYVSTAIDPGNDIPYISYYDASSGHLRLASPVPSGGGNCGPDNSWWCRTVDSGPLVGKYSSIAISKSDFTWKLGISYLDETNHALKYAVYSCFFGFCGWTFETIDTNLNPTSFTSLAFDSGASPHIAYQNDCGPVCSSLKYASYVGNGGNCGAGKWRCDTVQSVGYDGYGLYPSLGLNGANQPRIAYYDGWFGDLRYAADCGSNNCGNCGPNNTWQCSILDGTGNVGLFPSLKIDKGASENPRIAYYDSTNGKLKHAGFALFGNCGPGIIKFWQCDAIDNMGAGLLGYAGVSLAVDQAGKPLIAYLDASEAQAPARLRVARPVSAPGLGNCGPLYNWECNTVDGGGSSTNEGTFISLAFNSKGKPILAYYEEDDYYDGNLKVATLWDQLFLPMILKNP